MVFEYAVVEFTKEQSVDVVPQLWIESTEEGMFCYWPIQTSQSGCRQKVKKKEIPDKENWRKHPIMIFSYTDDYEKAVARAKRAMDTSNVESNDEGVAGTNKRRNVRPPSRYSDSEEEEDLRRTTNKNKSLGERGRSGGSEMHTSDVQVMTRPPTPPSYSAFSRCSSRSSNLSQEIRSRTVTPEIENRDVRDRSPIRIPRCLPDFPTDIYNMHTYYSIPQRSEDTVEVSRVSSRSSIASQGSCSRTPNSDRHSRFLPDMQADNYSTPRRGGETSESFEKKVLITLGRMEKYMEEHSNILRQLRAAQSVPIDDTDLENLLPEILDTNEAWEQLNEKIGDVNFKKSLVHSLSTLGGTSLGDTVRRMMRKIGTNKLWSTFSLKGKKEKKPLQTTAVYGVVTKASLRVHIKNKMSDVDEAIIEFLKHAPHQPGGAKYKKPQATQNRTAE